MSLIATIAERAAAADLPFLVIGGYAVNAHGYPRHTMDLDLLVQDTDRRAWDDLIRPLGYRPHQIHESFHMYNPTIPGQPALDLMLVDLETFRKLSVEAPAKNISGVAVRTPTLPHLIALKLHALRSDRPHRRELDLGDVVTLIHLNGVDLAAPEYRTIFERYASPALRAEVERRLAGFESSGS